jgi:hypothetical protein
MKKKIPKKNSIDGTNLPDSCLVELLDRCIISIKDIKRKTKKKKQDGTYDNAYIPVQFKKGVEFENQTNIYIKKAWLSFYKTKEGKPIYYIFISEFNTIKEQANEYKDANLCHTNLKENGIPSLKRGENGLG